MLEGLQWCKAFRPLVKEYRIKLTSIRPANRGKCEFTICGLVGHSIAWVNFAKSRENVKWRCSNEHWASSKDGGWNMYWLDLNFWVNLWFLKQCLLKRKYDFLNKITEFFLASFKLELIDKFFNQAYILFYIFNYTLSIFIGKSLAKYKSLYFGVEILKFWIHFFLDRIDRNRYYFSIDSYIWSWLFSIFLFMFWCCYTAN